MSLNRPFLLAFVFSLALPSVSARAFDNQKCLQAYAAKGGFKKVVGESASSMGSILIFSGTLVATPTFGLGFVPAAGMSMAGTTIGDFGDSMLTEVRFAQNIAQAMLESQAGVVGPYTSQIATDLNKQVFPSGFSLQIHLASSDLDGTTKERFRQCLGDRPVTPEEIAGVIQLMMKTGGLCTPRGGTLTWDEFAQLTAAQLGQHR